MDLGLSALQRRQRERDHRPAARSYGISTLMIKSGDGTGTLVAVQPALVVATLHAAGLKVCAWQYVYGNHPVAEADVGAAAVKAGADCLLIDAESEYEGKYVSGADLHDDACAS